jgi:hypothetical protein
MNNGETNTRDQRVVGAYRAASDTLDERPQDATRAAILAAAARAVDAQPQDAATGATSRRIGQRTRTRVGAFGPSRRPLALVASFLVATAALVLVTHTMQEQPASTLNARLATAEQKPMQTPEVSAPAEKEREQRRDANVERIPPTAELRSTDKIAAAPQPSTSARARAKQEAPVAGAAVAPPASPPPAMTPRAFSDEGKATASVREQADAPSPERVAPAPASASAESAPPAQAAKDVAANQSAKVARAEQRAAAPSEADVSAQGALAKAKPVERTAAIAGDSVENDPARWMERIIALRDAGHDEDADRELARLRQRYPDMKVPPSALPRTGTR